MIIGRPSLKTAVDWLSILQSYRSFVHPDYIVLEIGASSSEKTQILSRYCKQIIGIEKIQERIPQSSKNITYLNGDWEHLTNIISKNSIDLCISTHTLEHVKDDVRALNELYEVLKPGATALINTPNRKRLTRSIIELFAGKKKFPSIADEHEREYVYKDIVNLLSHTKFKTGTILPVGWGVQGGQCCWVAVERPPVFFSYLAHTWEIHLQK